MINLINDLLDIEKLEAGQMEMKLKNIPLWPVIEQSVDAVSHFASSHGVTIDAQPCAQAVYGDHDRLIQVVVNLLSNAVKFSPQGASVFVSFDEHDSFVTVNVKDAGRGVPDQYKALIFERFKQVKSEDATEKKGTGLGLPICKMIVESHGGTIGVESK
ncbi:MAG TPA: HAMP domain-containing sensor histidine kinase, partial [Candidatus Obscuribacterales bacterium]